MATAAAKTRGTVRMVDRLGVVGQGQEAWASGGGMRDRVTAEGACGVGAEHARDPLHNPLYGTSTVLDTEMSAPPAILCRNHGHQGRPRRAGRLRRGGHPHAPRSALRAAHRRGRPAEGHRAGKDATPLLGGLAIFAGALVAGVLFLPDNDRTEGILAAAALITIVGALDDRFDLPPFVKFGGQIAAAVVLVASGVVVDAFTFPFLHRVELGGFGGH